MSTERVIAQAVRTQQSSPVYSTVTQNSLGNRGSTFNGQSVLHLLESLITRESPLTVGKPGRSVTFLPGAEHCIVERLPAVGSSSTLPFNLGDAVVSPQTCKERTGLLPTHRSDGKSRNVLLGHAIALSLNLRMEKSLGALPVSTSMCTAGMSSGGGLNMSDVRSFAIPVSVVSSLKSKRLSQSVDGLLELVNLGLAGEPVSPAKLSEIAEAVGAINSAFEGRRAVVECYSGVPRR